MFVVPTNLPTERVADMFIGALECNDMVCSWCWGVRLADKLEGREHEFSTKEHGPWYANPKLYENEHFAMSVYEIEDESEALEFGDDGESDVPTDNVKVHVVRVADIQAGLELMASKYPSHLADMIQENDDACTHDVFLQSVVLKDLVYG